MTNFEVSSPILNCPFEEPKEHWWIVEGEAPQQRPGRRPAMYYYREPGRDQNERGGIQIELKLVNLIRERAKAWREKGWPGTSRTTSDLLGYWQRDGRKNRLFFAQVEAAETVIFLTEARADFRQGMDIPRDEPSEEVAAQGNTGFLRYACKMATGSGKTTVMAMLAAWSILNKVANRSDGRFSDAVLVICPNVTIRDRLQELDPELDEASLYRTRDLVPQDLMSLLRQGKVIVRNWHILEPQTPQIGGVSGRVVKAGVPVQTTEVVRIGPKSTTAHGSRYLTLDDFERQVAAGMLEVIEEFRDRQGRLVKVRVRVTRYVESDTSLVNRVLRDVGGKQNLLVFNDEAHHAYRIRRTEPDEAEGEDFGEEEEAEEFFKEATVWVEGLDRVHRLRRINFCVDLSATPYFLGRVGQQTNRPFPWVVSDFGLIDSIESGLVKIPQLAVRDTTGAEIPGYFNIWQWILQPGRLTASERGGMRASPKPEAILKWSHTPIAMLGGLWEETWRQRQSLGEEPRPPVFILVCKNTALANVIYEWLANGKCPTGIPPANLLEFRNRDGQMNTIVVHSKVVHETDTGQAKSDESRWMRFTLDTVGRLAWPSDSQGREIYPDGFADLAEKMKRPLHPPGRDVRCIVSVGMLTEGWDCSTVTHIIGLRPFMSQLLCEQVVGRGLRRASYTDFDAEGRLREEVAKVFGVPFQIVPFKANPQGGGTPPVKRNHVRAVPERAAMEIRFPRIEGYTQAVRNFVQLDWDHVPTLLIEPGRIPSEVEMKALSISNKGRPMLTGPGQIDRAGLEAFRSQRRLQELVFDVAHEFARRYSEQPTCNIPSHVLFPQLARIVQRFVHERVTPFPPADIKDLFLAPYYGWLVEVLLENLRGDTSQGEVPELPRVEATRGPGSTADVDFWTSRDVREVMKSHVNYVVADTTKWEQSATYYLDTDPRVAVFVKNAGLGFAIPYLHNGQIHDYIPDFIVRLDQPRTVHLILETKGYDPLRQIKAAAAWRWVNAVKADGRFGAWTYHVIDAPSQVPQALGRAVAKGGESAQDSG